jgi:hypothetical protein
MIDNTLVSLRNDTGSVILIGAIDINPSESVVIWDTIDYESNFDNFDEVVGNISTFNQNIFSQDLVLIYNGNDQSVTQAFEVFSSLLKAYNTKPNAIKSFSLIKQNNESVYGLIGSATTTRPGLLSIDGYEKLEYIDLSGNLNGVDITDHASRHAPNGADPLSTAVAVSLSPGSTNAEGSSTSFARADHTHALPEFGSTAGTFAQGDDPRLSDKRLPIDITRTITVSADGYGVDFVSIKDAVDYAVSEGAAQGNAWRIIVYPGDYFEDPMTIPDGVIVYSNDFDSVRVFANNANEDLFTCIGCVIENVWAFGVTDPLKAIFRCPSAGPTTLLKGIKVANCSTGVFIENGAACIVLNSSVVISGLNQAIDTVIGVDGIGSLAGVLNFFAIVAAPVLPFYVGNPINTFLCCRNNAEALITNSYIRLPYNNTNNRAIRACSTGIITTVGSAIYDCYTAFEITAAGQNSRVLTQSNILSGNDRNYFSANVTGGFLGSLSADVIGNNQGSFSGILQLIDEKKSLIVGNFGYKFPTGKITEVDRFLYDTQSTGLVSGGDVLDAGGLFVTVSDGYGWIKRNESDDDMFSVAWAEETLELDPDATNYVVYDSNTESLEIDLSPPGLTKVLLATVVTNTTDIRFLHRTVNIVTSLASNIHSYLLNTHAYLLQSGLSVSEGSSNTQISVSTGGYYRALTLIHYDGYVDVDFSYFYGTNGANEISNQNNVNITQYDNAGVLTSLTAGYFRSDTVYLTSDGRISIILGTDQFATQTLAEETSRGNIPSFISFTAIPLARLIVEQNVGIVSITDERPRSSSAGSGVGGVSSHSALSDLDKPEDHLWAMLVDGTRTMTGNLNLGSNNITNIGTVNGVTVQSHASRHNPGGADALATGTPVNVLISASPAEGSAASYSRSDHQHGIATAAPETIGTVNAAGSASSVSRSDHIHAHGNQGGGALHAAATTSVAGFMSAADKTKLDGVATSATNTPLTATAPENVTKAAAVVGISTDAARADHKHDIATAASVSLTVGGANAEGSSTSLARADHTHAIAAGTPVSIGTANAAGAATTFVRSDHVHAHGNLTGGTLHSIATDVTAGFMSAADKDKLNGVATGATNTPLAAAAPANVTKAAAVVGVATAAARADHKHDIATAAASTLTVGGSNAEGSSTNLARADHTHALPDFGTTAGTFAEGNDARLSDSRTPLSHAASHLPDGGDALATAAPAVGSVEVGGIADIGVANSFSRSDHIHTVSAGTPVSIGTANSAGAATTFVRSDHVHAHGDLAGGTLHANASTSVAGFMSAADKTKLDGVAASATNTPLTAVAPVNVTKAAAVVGVATAAARADHKHDVTTAAAVALTVGIANAEGVSTSLARADHTHAISAGTPVSIGTANAEGAGTTFARSNHVHAHGDQTVGTLHAAVTTTVNGFMIAADKVKLDGIAASATNTPLTASAPVNVTKAAAVVGVATAAARADHKHDVATAAAVTLAVGGANAEGVSTSLSRADHTHALPAFGTTVGTFCQGNDARLSDDRTASGLRTATTIVSISAAAAPAAGNILAATSSTAAAWTNNLTNLNRATFAAEFNNGNSGTAATINWSTNGQKQRLVVNGNATLTFTAPPGVGNFLLKLVHDATATAYTILWPATLRWPGGTAPTLTNTANSIDIISFYYDGTNYFGVASFAFAAS